MKTKYLLTWLCALNMSGAALADEVIADDLIVIDDACFGPTCLLGELFPLYFQVKIKSDVPTLILDDSTSVLSADWRIQANSDGVNGFYIRNQHTTHTPFTILGNAPNNSLFVAGNGDIGLNTTLPGQDLHIQGNSEAAIRFEDTVGTPYTWDIRGNSDGFYLFDNVTADIPFEVRAGAAHRALIVASDSNIGIGVFDPDSPLHVERDDGTAKILVEETGGGGAQELFQMKSNGGSYFTLSNTNSGRDWFFTHENAAQGRFIITASTNASQGMFLDPDGDLQIGGTLTENSDKNAKMAIVPVDASAILDKVAELPVSMWTYKDDTSGARHVGPMAQDFYAAFGLGATETGIATLDTSGVALASIKALNNNLEGAQVYIDQLHSRIGAQESVNRSLSEDVVALRRDRSDLDARLRRLETLLLSTTGTAQN